MFGVLAAVSTLFVGFAAAVYFFYDEIEANPLYKKLHEKIFGPDNYEISAPFNVVHNVRGLMSI